MSQAKENISEVQFGRWREFFFPIHKHELRKFLPMVAMLILICFNYTILRNVKDAIVVTTSGAEVIPFIKVWVVLPAAVLVTYIFAKLVNRYSQERVFYFMISGFLASYALFAFVLYPLRDSIHPIQTTDALSQMLPAGFRGLINMLRYWTFTGFYVLSELWSSMIMTTLFWGLANEITKLHEATRFYAVFSIGANISGILAGQTTVWLTEWSDVSRTGDWETLLRLLVLSVLAAGIASMAIFYWMNRNVLKGPAFNDLHSPSEKLVKKKKRLSLKESFSYLSNSKYILCIAAVVVSYNLVINLVEIVWKSKLSQLYSSPIEYNTYMANLTTVTNIVSTVIALFMARIIASFGWTKTAMITPIIMLITCAGFFGFLFLQDYAPDTSTAVMFLGASPLAIAVFFGGAQNCLSRAAKYSVFDATKEMAFIPLDHESKLKGKAAIDGVGSRLGKSGGSFIHQGLLMIFVTVAGITPYVAFILLAVIVAWIFAVNTLGKMFGTMAQATDPEAVVEPVPEKSTQWDGSKPTPVAQTA